MYVSPEIVEVLKQCHKENCEASVAAELGPLMTPEPSIGSLVRSYLFAVLGMHKNYGDE